MPAPLFRRALVIRGGALGDFLLTLPVLSALRRAEPAARIEVLAYPHIAKLAEAAGMIDAARSIEYGPLAGFFTKGAVLDPDLREYFASFDLVISYLFDPDEIFARHLQNCGVRRLLRGPHLPQGPAHAIDELAAPLAELGITEFQRDIILPSAPANGRADLIAVHPGSGSPTKNWPAARWLELCTRLLAEYPGTRLAVIGGEADHAAMATLRPLSSDRTEFWENLALPDLSRQLQQTNLYLGHDSGVSHLAAVTGTPSLLLFGPTNPSVWAPPHARTRVIAAPDGSLDDLPVSTVYAAVRDFLDPLRLASKPGRNENHDR